MKGFRNGTYRILVATDIAARGIDVTQISHVINYDIPDTTDAYIHRIGRTGRASRSGTAYTLVTADDGDMVRNIERILDCPIERRTLDGFDYGAVEAGPQAESARRTLKAFGGRKSGISDGGGRMARCSFKPKRSFGSRIYSKQG